MIVRADIFSAAAGNSHNTGRTGADSISEWPQIKLVQGDIVDVGADGVCETGAALAEVFLFVEDEVLGASHHASILNTLDRLGDCNAGQYRIGCKALPIT